MPRLAPASLQEAYKPRPQVPKWFGKCRLSSANQFVASLPQFCILRILTICETIRRQRRIIAIVKVLQC